MRQYSAIGADLGVFVSGLVSPAWITADHDGNIYVSDPGSELIRKFSPSGEELMTITPSFIPGGLRVTKDGTIYVADYPGAGVYRFSATGADLGLFGSTRLLGRVNDFLAFDADGRVYLTTFDAGTIRQLGTTGLDLGDFVVGFGGVEGLAFDSNGNLYASSYSGNKIRKYAPSGEDLGTFASTHLDQPYGLAFDRAGTLYVANYGGPSIHRFSSSGADLGAFVTTGLVFPRDLVFVESCARMLTFSSSQYPQCFRGMRRSSGINAGLDLGGTGHSAVNFTGPADSTGDTWITLYDTTPGDVSTTDTFGSVTLTADVLTHKVDGKKGVGLLALYNEGKKGLTLTLYNEGNTDTLVLGKINQGGKIATLATISLGGKVREDAWYRMSMDLIVTDTSISVTGKVFKHSEPTDPDGNIGNQIGRTLAYEGPRPPALDITGQVGIIGSASGVKVQSSVTNFTVGN